MPTHARFHLLIIDPQNDFCDLPDTYLVSDGDDKKLTPALPVSGAHADMLRLANLVYQGGDGINAMTITLDSHHYLDIAHPTFWWDQDHAAIPPFTQITAQEVRTGKYLPRMQNVLPQVIAYLDQLEATGRYHLMVWPVHCEIGSWGSNIHIDLQRACHLWEQKNLLPVSKVIKGQNPWTEHYSAIRAEVPDPADKLTQSNQHLLARLAKADYVYIAGEAGSHCVKATTEHIAEHFGAKHIGKIVLITDCMSPVTGFEQQYQNFLSSMMTQGARCITAAQALQECIANMCTTKILQSKTQPSKSI